jgi:hypothetical protein
LKIQKGLSEDTKGAIRRYKRGYQKIPKGLSEDTKRGYHKEKLGTWGTKDAEKQNKNTTLSRLK